MDSPNEGDGVVGAEKSESKQNYKASQTPSWLKVQW